MSSHLKAPAAHVPTPFYKYEGGGNDFVILDKRNEHLGDHTSLDASLIQRICQRRHGVGADGLIIMQKSSFAKHDFEMRYFNADGSKGFCLNGARCVARLAFGINENEDKDKGTLVFACMSITLKAQMADKGQDDVVLTWSMKEERPQKTTQGGYVLRVGGTHYVIPLHEVMQLSCLDEVGKRCNEDKEGFSNGVNVHYVERIDEKQGLCMRSYERGVGETLCCGSGAVAAAIVAKHIGWVAVDTKKVQVVMRGGELGVGLSYSKDQQLLLSLQGPAKEVYCGELNF